MRNYGLLAVTGPLDDAGIHYTVRKGGKHLMVRWVAAGQKRMVTVAGTGSDYRAEKNSRCLVRRILRQDGVLA